MCITRYGSRLKAGTTERGCRNYTFFCRRAADAASTTLSTSSRQLDNLSRENRMIESLQIEIVDRPALDPWLDHAVDAPDTTIWLALASSHRREARLVTLPIAAYSSRCSKPIWPSVA